MIKSRTKSSPRNFAIAIVTLALLASGCSTADKGDQLVSAAETPEKSLSFSKWTIGGSKHRDLEKAFLDEKIAAGLNRRAVNAAVESEYAALEKGKTGAPVKWSFSENVSGIITPSQPYQVGASSCRRYVHEVKYNGDIRKNFATACREKDGNWVPLT